jgi:hypothetical protein
VFGCEKTKTHKTRKTRKTHKTHTTRKTHKKSTKPCHPVINDLEEKQKYIAKTISNITSNKQVPAPVSVPVPETKTIELISAYTLVPEETYNSQFKSITKKLETINTNEIKGRDFIKTNFIEPDSIRLTAAAPSPASALIDPNEIIGITNAPMYAPVESIDKSVDIFLINQINTTKNNSLAYLDQPIITLNNKSNYIENIITRYSDPSKNVENVIGWEKISTRADI